MSGKNTEDNATARAIADLQESKHLMREEIKVMKTSGATCIGNDPLQQPDASVNSVNLDSSGYHSGEAQRKHGHKTAITMMRMRMKEKIEKRTMTMLQKMKVRHCFRCLKQETPS